ncbi:ubiquinone anaerobic biosynthesis protein UbiV [Azospirillum halopraeferens]|uniref:ubiquinone anaerobic biosynthesis protein UbiV n=1 Tax=Azospirillum halopraeferens TaxID=34010 RepID=UPI0003F83A2D|nr:U32 family peptidase [Azospirillum halopraeferens]
MTTPPLLTLGPVLFNWPAERWCDFYARIADEAPVDVVHLGEIVCSKRLPFLADQFGPAVERLEAAGKTVVLSTPILVTTERERAALAELVEAAPGPVEANDLAAVALLAGRPHLVGPYVNVYNEATLAWMAARGALSVSLNPELPAPSVGVLAAAAADLGVDVEVQVFGRMPLAISARCYHARSHGLHKDGCQFVCGNDPDGLAVATLDAQPFLAVNGTQTLSHACLDLSGALEALTAQGVRRLRLSPHAVDMVRVARGFRDVLDGRRDAAALSADLADLVAGMPLADGFYHDRAGYERVA